jgi:uncharacterized MAPEG superfamily protein
MFDMTTMAPVAIVTVLILIEYFVFTLLVGKARVQTKTDAPATAGDPLFERYFRVQQNSLERMVVVIPAMWLFALYLNAPVAAALGLVYVVARILYSRGYVADPAKRGMGFGIGVLAEAVLLLGALGAAALAWFD